MADRFWVANSGNWSDNANHWSASSGGAPGASKPTVSDRVFFDANSFSIAGQTVTVDEAAFCDDMDWSTVTNTPDLNGQNSISVSGSLNIPSGMTINIRATFNFVSTGSENITFSITPARLNFNISGSGTFTLQSDISIPFGTASLILLSTGTLATNNKNIVTPLFIILSGTLNLGSSTITISGAGVAFDCYNTATVNAGTSVINFSSRNAAVAFEGGGKTWNTINLLTDTTTGNEDIRIRDSSTFTNFTISTTVPVKFEAGSTQTITTFTANGSENNLITLRSETSPSTWTISAGTASVSWVDVKDGIAAGAASPFNDTIGGVNSGNNTNWLFPNISTRPLLGVGK